MRAAERESNVMVESQIFLTPAKGTRVVVPLKDPMPHGSRYVTRWHITDPMSAPFGHKILLNLTFNYSVSAEFSQNINIRGIEIPATRRFRQDMVNAQVLGRPAIDADAAVALEDFRSQRSAYS